jgi:hypothetical protein
LSYLPKPSGEGSFLPPPAGTFAAICYRIVDLGTQTTSYKGETQQKHKVLISWELKDDECAMPDGRPMSIHQRYTWSMHEKSLLRKHLESWRGRNFDESKDFGPGGFDIRKLLGVPCMLTIVHNESGGKTYANIVGVSKLPKQMNAGSLDNETAYLWMDESFDDEVFGKLSDGIQSTIRKSPEYHELHSKSGAEVAAAEHAREDEIPF